jgi:DNA polymerase III alpha subunit
LIQVALDDAPTFDLVNLRAPSSIFQIEVRDSANSSESLPDTLYRSDCDISLSLDLDRSRRRGAEFLQWQALGLSAFDFGPPDLYDVLHETEGVVVFHEQVIPLSDACQGAPWRR